MSIFNNITEGYIKIIFNNNTACYCRYYNNNKQMLFSHCGIILRLPHSTTLKEFNIQFNSFINNLKTINHGKFISASN